MPRRKQTCRKAVSPFEWEKDDNNNDNSNDADHDCSKEDLLKAMLRSKNDQLGDKEKIVKLLEARDVEHAKFEKKAKIDNNALGRRVKKLGNEKRQLIDQKKHLNKELKEKDVQLAEAKLAADEFKDKAEQFRSVTKEVFDGLSNVIDAAIEKVDDPAAVLTFQTELGRSQLLERIEEEYSDDPDIVDWAQKMARDLNKENHRLKMKKKFQSGFKKRLPQKRFPQNANLNEDKDKAEVLEGDIGGSQDQSNSDDDEHDSEVEALNSNSNSD